MTLHSDAFLTRLADVEFARWLRELAVRVPKRTLPGNKERLDALADHLHDKVCHQLCSFDEYLSAADKAVQAENPYGETMNADDKKKIAEEVAKRSSTWFGELMNRRADKGGKLVLWWRRTFGKISPDAISDAALDVTARVIDRKGKRK